MAKAKKPTTESSDLSSEIISTLNTQFKDQGHTAYYLSDPNVATDVTEWIPTGHTLLDLAVSNRPNGGWPVGKIIEITGLEACVTRDTEITVQILD